MTDEISNSRLGFLRRNRRDYSVHQRPAGKTCGERMCERELLQTVLLLIISYLNVYDDEEEDDSASLYLDLTLLCIMDILHINQPRLLVPRPVPHMKVSFDSFYSTEYDRLFGFNKEDVQLLHEALEFPPYLIVGEGSHSFQVDSCHCFLYLLYRLHSPSQRQTLDQQVFCYDYSSLSRIFNETTEFIDDNYSSHLRNLHQIVHKFQMFNEVIISKMNDLYPGEPLPGDCLHCALFADGVRFRVSRPSGPFWVQKVVFSGDKWYHNQGSLAVTGPDGIIYDWYDIPVGKYNDKHFLADSGINNLMESLQADHIIKYWIYSDRGFDNSSCVRSAAHGPAYVSPAQKVDNHKMSRERITEEWCFAKVKNLFPFTTRPNLLKLQLVDVAAYIRVAVFLTNCHTCINQSETGLYFNCLAPSLHEYLQMFMV